MLPQTEDVARPPDQAGLVERLDLLGTETFDVEGVAADVVPQPPDRLGRTDQPAGAAPDRLALGADGVGLAAWALVGQHIFHADGRPLLDDHPDHLRDHVAGALDDHGVADADRRRTRLNPSHSSATRIPS